jgi:hypothetical protein
MDSEGAEQAAKPKCPHGQETTCFRQVHAIPKAWSRAGHGCADGDVSFSHEHTPGHPCVGLAQTAKSGLAAFIADHLPAVGALVGTLLRQRPD